MLIGYFYLCFICKRAVLENRRVKKAGDKVYAKNPETGEQSEKEVVRVFVEEADTLVHLTVEGEEITTTEKHPFYVNGKGWVGAGKLTTEDRVVNSKGEELAVENVYIEKLKKPVEVYNFEVKDFHTYYVGNSEVLVHNSCSVENVGGKGAGGSKTQYEGADLPLGSKHNQMNQPKNPSYQPSRNTGTDVGGTKYTGHALDRMQERGIPPSAVNNTINNGVATSSRGGTTKFYDSVNNITTITNDIGEVVTVRYGQ